MIIYAFYLPYVLYLMFFFCVAFSKNEWGAIGPALVNPIVKKMLRIDEVSQMWREGSSEFRVLEPSTFFLIPWSEWGRYFFPQSRVSDIELLRKFNKKNVIGAHVWNQLRSVFPLLKRSNVLYMKLARPSCPKILDDAPEQF